MAEQWRIRRDVDANIKASVLASSEIGHNTNTNRFHLGNGSTQGGFIFPNNFDTVRDTLKIPRVLTAGLSLNQYAAILDDTPIVSYADGMSIVYRPHITNTGAPAFALNGISFNFVVKFQGGSFVNLEAGEFVGGRNYVLRWSAFNGHWVCETLSSGAIPSTGAMRYLATATANNSASLDFVNVITSQYKDYLFLIDAIFLVSSGADLLMRTSNNNGASFFAGAADYRFQNTHTNIQATPTITNNGGSAGGLQLSNLMNGRGFGQVRWSSPMNAVDWKPAFWEMWHTQSGGPGISITRGSGSIVNSGAGLNAQNAARFVASSGNISSGSIHLFGIQTA